MSLETVTPGIVSGTGRVDAGRAFRRDPIGLAARFEQPGLRCRSFGDSDLVIETGRRARDGRRSCAETPATTRCNLPDAAASAASLRARGGEVAGRALDRGIVGTSNNPARTPCALKDAAEPVVRRPR